MVPILKGRSLNSCIKLLRRISNAEIRAPLQQANANK